VVYLARIVDLKKSKLKLEGVQSFKNKNHLNAVSKPRLMAVVFFQSLDVK